VLNVIKGTIFFKKKCVFLFPKLLFETFLILRRDEWNIIINAILS